MSLLIGRKVECQQVMFHQSKCTADNTERILTLRGGRRVFSRGGCLEWTGSGEPKGSRKQPQGFHCFTLLYFPPHSVSVALHHSAPLIRKKCGPPGRPPSACCSRFGLRLQLCCDRAHREPLRISRTFSFQL